MVRANLVALTLSVATLCGFSTKVFAVSTMTDQMLLLRAPVPTMNQPKDLRFFADRPGDAIITSQKPSLTMVSPDAQLIRKEAVLQAYRAKLGAAEGDQALASGYRVFGNFIDGMKGKAPFESVSPTDPANLWQVIIPNREQVTESILQLEWFHSGLGGHAQIRFKLSLPLLLISQENPTIAKFIDGDVIYALMALRSASGNKTWDAVTGLTGAFASSYLLASTQHMANVQLAAGDGSFVEQYRLNLSALQLQNMFSYALQVGPRAGEHEIYNLIYNSCIQAALRALKSVDLRVDQWEFNPYQVAPQLQKLGLISAQLPSANDEFKSPVRTLENSENATTLKLIAKLRGVMSTQIFEESLRTFAAVVVDDQWTTQELNLALSTVSAAAKGLSFSSLKDLSQLKTEIAARLAALPVSGPQRVKTQASVARLLTELQGVITRNQLELPELLAYLTQASLTGK